MHTSKLLEAWPPFGLVIKTPRLELRLPSDEDLATLVDLALNLGVHDPETMPFTHPWTDECPEWFLSKFMQYHWDLRRKFKPEVWALEFGVYVDGEIVGIQGVGAKNFGVLRSGITGSWLLMSRHRQGIGTEMREAILHLMFDGLDAEEMHSAAFDDNVASHRVSKKLGYLQNGYKRESRRGFSSRMTKLILTREAWKLHRRNDIWLNGVEEFKLFAEL